MFLLGCESGDGDNDGDDEDDEREKIPYRAPVGRPHKKASSKTRNKQKQNTQTPDTNTHKQTFISKRECVAQTPQCTHTASLCVTEKTRMDDQWREKQRGLMWLMMELLTSSTTSKPAGINKSQAQGQAA